MSEISILSVLGEDRLIRIASYYGLSAINARGCYEDQLISLGSGCNSENIIGTLTHEFLHQLLENLFNKEVCRSLDSLYYPNKEKLRELLTINSEVLI